MNKSESEKMKEAFAEYMKNKDKESSKEEKRIKLPKFVEEEFLAKDKKGNKIINGEKLNEKGPLLFLIRNNGITEVIEGVTEGHFSINTKGSKVAKKIHLPNSKLQSVKYGKNHFKAWFAYEDEALSYPTEVLKDASIFHNIFTQIITNYSELNDVNANRLAWAKTIFFILIGIALGVYFLAQSGVINLGF